MTGNNIRSSVYAGIFSIFLAEIILFISHLLDHQIDMLIGWGVSFITHLAGFRLFRRSIGQPVHKFMAMAIGGIFIRLFLLIIFIFLVSVGGFLQAGPFVIGLLTAYFIGSLVEITWLVSNRGTIL